jgi:hypothetical protein
MKSVARITKLRKSMESKMKIMRLYVLPLALCWLLFSGCVSLKQTLPVEARALPGGRQMLVTVGQYEINSSINQSNMTAATGGGLLFALIDAGVNNSRAKSAEEAIVPVRDSMAGYQFDQKALAISERISKSVSWLDIKKIELNKDTSNVRFSNALDSAATDQLLSITYDYQLQPNFEGISVGANVAILLKATPKNAKPEQRALLANAAFTRMFVCIVPLDGVSKERDANVALWTKDNGARIRASLDQALEKLGEAVKKGLELTPDKLDGLKAVKNTKVNALTGKVIERDAAGTYLLGMDSKIYYIFGST